MDRQEVNECRRRLAEMEPAPERVEKEGDQMTNKMPDMSAKAWVPYVEAVRCDACGKLHDSKGDTFFTFYGNVMIGLDGGIVGGCINEEGKVYRALCYCRTTKCMEGVLLKYIEDPATSPLGEVTF